MHQSFEFKKEIKNSKLKDFQFGNNMKLKYCLSKAVPYILIKNVQNKLFVLYI